MSNPPTFLPYGRQQVSEEDIAAVVSVLRSDYLTTGPATESFERAFEKFTGAAHAIACANGTAALHLAGMSLEMQAGDAVIVPSVTFLATANGPHTAGAEVVFADVDPDSGLLTAAALARALDDARGRGLRVRAVLPVHLNGQCADLAALRGALHAQPDVLLIEDACHAVGGRYADGGMVGDCSTGDLATFSLHPVKTITAGEGGVITCNDPVRAALLRQLRNHGMVRAPDAFTQPDLALDVDGTVNPWYYEMPRPGLNYRATDIGCALAESQLARLPTLVDRRAELLARYARRLTALAPLAQPLPYANDVRTAWHLCVVLIDFLQAGLSRAELMGRLRRHGVGTQVHYIPVHHQPYYRQRYGNTQLPGADRYYRRCLSLPLFVGMECADVDRVVDTLGDALRA